MLRIRLQRTGRENLPTFRLVVAEHQKPVKGKYKEILGHFLPLHNPKILEYKAERIVHWIKHGASPSNTVARLLKKNGFKEQGIDLDTFIESYTKKKKKGEQPAAETAAAPKPPNSETHPPSSSPSGGGTPQTEPS